MPLGYADRSHALRGNAPRTLRVQQKTLIREGQVTRSVTGCIPTRSEGTIVTGSLRAVGPASAGKTPDLPPQTPNCKYRSKRLRESIQLF
jgi:hypothetical protein